MINLTCQKTHILAWLNLDNTLSLKINGVKYLAHSKVDKRGERYWKVDGFNPTPSTPQAPEQLKEEIAAILKKPMSEQTLEDRKKWEQWNKAQAQEKAQKLQASIASQSQKEVESLSQKLAEKNNHEPVNP